MATAELAFPAQAGIPAAGSSTPPAHETISGIPVPPQAPADLPALSPSGPFPQDSIAYAQSAVPAGTGAEGGAAPETRATSTTPGAQAESGATPGAKTASIAPLTDPLDLFSLTLPYPAIMGAYIPPGAQLSPGDGSLIPSPPCTTEITARLLQMKRLPTGGTEILIRGGGNRPESGDGSEYHLRFTITDPDFGEKLREIANRHRLTALDGTDRFKPSVNTGATYLTIESGTRRIHAASNMPLLTPDCICEVFRLFRDLAQSQGHAQPQELTHSDLR